MTTARYSTNLITLDDANTDTGYVEPTAAGWTALNNETFSETDLFIQGTTSISATVKTGVGATLFNNGTPVTIPTDGAFLVWAFYGTPNALDTEANGGIRQIIGATTANFSYVNQGGSDTYTYGGWLNLAMGAPDQITTDIAVGSGAGTTYQYFGWAYNALAVPSKGNPYVVDCMRYGRCDIVVEFGDLATGYANFNEISQYNDLNTAAAFSKSQDATGYNRFGIFQNTGGSNYLWKGLLSLGTATNAVDFRDSNRTIVCDNTKNVTSNFNKIEVVNASSNILWESISISALNSIARGNFEMINNATVSKDGCTFIDMGTFTYLTNATITGCVFRRCGTVFPKGATITSSDFFNPSTATGLIQYDAVSDGTNVTDCNFTNNTTNPSIRITDSGTYTFDGHQFFGTATTYVEFTGTGTCTIIPAGGSNIVQAKCAATGGGSITVEAPVVNFTISNLKAGSEVRAYTGSISDPINAIEIGGIESSTGTEFTFQHTSGGSAGYIQIFHLNYLPITYIVTAYQSVDQTIQISQVGDRQYLNP